MASGKKKLDEYHLKILRQLVSLPSNKECFDCHQRGPTYVNVTIGSFVCTTCSGMLRGLTPPHRVKSISVATFTPDEIDFVKTRGNDYCRRVWLGLCDTEQPTKDEQQIKDFMISKYERKRYYLNPSSNSAVNMTNGSGSSTPNGTAAPLTPVMQTKPVSTVNGQVTLPAISHPSATLSIKPPNHDISNNNNNRTKNVQIPVNGISGSNINNNTDNKNLNNSSSVYINNNIDNSNSNILTPDQLLGTEFANTTTDPFSSSTSQFNTPPAQASFANFDNNPIFSSSSSTAAAHISLPATLNHNVPMRNGLLQHNVAPTNRWSFAGLSETGEDRYAALKDLDSLMKSQKQQEQQSTSNGQTATGFEWGTNGGANAGAVWTNQAYFGSVPQNSDKITTTPNPFATGDNLWGSGNSFSVNPFRNNTRDAAWCGNVPNSHLTNGFPTSQSLNFPPAKTSWNSDSINNPFTVSNSSGTTNATGLHSSNPFL